MQDSQSNNSFAIYHNFVINGSLKAVFDAITLPKHLNNWWPLASSGEPKVGTIYNFNFTDAYNWFGSVVKCDPNTSFYIKMTEADADWNPTTFGFDLEEIGDSVSVKFSHTNWPVCNIEFKQSSYCWAILLNGLKNYVEKGVIIPFENRE
jgi:uncharacterized protein YndB with AHSA1/START domain